MVALLVLAITSGTTVAQASRAEQIPSSSSDDHAWYLAANPDKAGRFILRHIGWLPDETAGPTTYTDHGVIDRAPLGMVAVDSRIYVVLPPDAESPDAPRPILSTSVQYRESLNAWYTDPPDRPRLENPLPSGGYLAALAGHHVGPAALLLPRSARSKSEDEAELVEPRLMQLVGARWTDIALPDDFVARGDTFMGTAGEQGTTLVILTGAEDRSSTTRVWRWTDDEWSSSTINLASSAILSVTRADHQLALIHTTDTSGEVAVSYLRPGGLVRLAAIERPSLGWGVIGQQRGLLVMRQASAGGEKLQVDTIDAVTGELAEGQELVLHRPDVMQLYISALVMACMIFGILLLFILRPNPQIPMQRPEGFVIGKLGPRLLATIFDLAPGAGLAMLLTDVAFVDVVRIPMFTAEVFTTIPFMIMVSVCVVHGFIGEAITGRSIGKAMMGLRVVDGDGQAPGVRQSALRAFGKFMTLMVPVVAVFVVLNPLRQGFGDILGRTLVGHPGDEPEDGAAADQSSNSDPS